MDFRNVSPPQRPGKRTQLAGLVTEIQFLIAVFPRSVNRWRRPPSQWRAQVKTLTHIDDRSYVRKTISVRSPEVTAGQLPSEIAVFRALHRFRRDAARALSNSGRYRMAASQIEPPVPAGTEDVRSEWRTCIMNRTVRRRGRRLAVVASVAAA